MKSSKTRPSQDICTQVAEILENDNLTAFKRLFDNGKIDLGFKMGMGTPILIDAARYGSEQIFNFLKDKGANLKVTHERENALTAVCIAGGPYQARHKQRLRIAKIIVDSGVGVNEFEGKGYTALHNAALYGFDEMVEFLIQSGAHVDAKDLLKRTPLHLHIEQSIMCPSLSTIKLLLEYGADINSWDHIGTRPIGLAKGNQDLVNLLLQYGEPDKNLSEHEQKEKEFVEFAIRHRLERGTTKGAQYDILPIQPKSLRELSAKVVANNKATLFQQLLAIPTPLESLSQDFPEIDIDPVRIFKRSILNSLAAIKFAPNQKEAEYIKKIKQALETDKPYNAVHGVVRDMLTVIKRGWASVFKDHMTPLRNEIVQHMKDYLSNKKEYEKQKERYENEVESQNAKSI